MKNFHECPPPCQWAVALMLFVLLMGVFAAAALGTATVFGLDAGDPAQLGASILIQLVGLLPFWMMAASFFLAPLLRLKGVLRYYSPYLVATQARKHHLDLHGATLFDYIHLFHWRERGRRAARKILTWYVEGLLALADEIATGRLPGETTLSATSYVFSESIARRYGFQVETGSRFSVGGILTYPTQVLTYSFAKGHMAFPPIHHARRATILGASLAAQSERLEKLHRRLFRESQTQ